MMLKSTVMDPLPLPLPMELPAQDAFIFVPKGLPSFNSGDMDLEVPFFLVWDGFKSEGIPQPQLDIDDYFDEIQHIGESEEHVYTGILPPLENELRLGPEDLNELDLIPLEDHGIEFEGSYRFLDHLSLIVSFDG